MSEDQRSAIAKKTIVYATAAMEAVTVRRDLEYPAADGAAARFDLYAPPDAAAGARRPLVLMVFGFPHPMFADGLKETAGTSSWARLLASGGLAVVAYTYRDPIADLGALIVHLRGQAEALGIDDTRIGLWSSSGNVPTALAALMDPDLGRFRCAALLYGYLLDFDGGNEVAQAAGRFGFATPAAGRSIADLPVELPLLVARAGRDQTPGINAGIDRFVAAALARNLPLTLINLAHAPHAFDLFEDSDASRQVIQQVAGFFRHHLVG